MEEESSYKDPKQLVDPGDGDESEAYYKEVEARWAARKPPERVVSEVLEIPIEDFLNPRKLQYPKD